MIHADDAASGCPCNLVTALSTVQLFTVGRRIFISSAIKFTVIFQINAPEMDMTTSLPLYTVCAKNVATLSRYDCDIHQSILITFGVNITEKKPNSITLASSEIASNMFEARSCQIPLH